MGNLYFHADDFGLDDEVSDNVIDCIKHGALSSISIICTTGSFEKSILKLKHLNTLPRMCLHINLVEGHPTLPISRVSYLVNQRGEFKYSFLKLWMNYLISGKKKKAELKDQIRSEIINQIRIFRSVLLKHNIEVPLQIDSHTHVHLLPFIQNLLIGISMEERVAFVRTAHERINFIKELCYVNNYTNLLKNVVLKYLSRMFRKRIKATTIRTNEFFIGIIHTGKMNICGVKSLIKRVNNDKSVEVLLHPGGVKNIESVSWTENRKFIKYYNSNNRIKEKNVLLSTELRYILDKLNKEER